MASSSKKKTTMAKLNRERAVRERRLEKEAKRAARRQTALAPQVPDGDTRGDEPDGDAR